MVRYTRSKNIHPVKLDRDGLINLIELIKKDFIIEKSIIRIHAHTPDKDVSENTLEAFLSCSILPEVISNLAIEAITLEDDKSKIGRKILIVFYNNFINLEVSGGSEEWVIGKYTQLTEFLSKNKPAFWFFRSSTIAFLLGSLTGISTIITPILFFSSKQQILPWRSSILLFLLIYILIGILFFLKWPKYSQIIINKKESFLQKHKDAILAVGLIASFSTVIGVIIQIIKFLK
jgi:hypothetical protein